MTGIKGPILTEAEKHFLDSYQIGGVLLFSRNYENPAQLKALTESIQELNRENPFLIAVDQEGGRVARFRSSFVQFPPMGHLAQVHPPETFFSVGEIMAKELLAAGINLNFAPVCDIVTNEHNEVIGDRAFGNNKKVVSECSVNIIKGFQSQGLLCCAKHFPGHGNTKEDSHHQLPFVKRSLEELENSEFIPFTQAIKANVPFIMTAHLLVKALDPSLPASLSPKTYGLLRKELSFRGLVITDDMQMGGVTSGFSLEDASCKALDAGADIIEYRDDSHAQRAFMALLEAVQSGKLDEEMVDAKVARVKAFKKEHLIPWALWHPS